MKISIVTISFNQGEFLERTIHSVLNQKGVDFEYIIVDAESSDGSLKIIDKYRADFTQILIGKDRGPADGLNKGFDLCKGDYIGYLNADDMYEPDALKRVYNFILENNNADVIYGNGFRIDKNDNKTKRIFADKFSLRKYAFEAFNFIQPSMFIKADAFKSVNGFNIGNKTCWDAELLIDIALTGKEIVYTNNFLSNFRLHDQSISGTGKTIDQYLMDRNRIKEKIILNKGFKDIPLQKQFLSLLNYIQNPNKILSRLNLPK